jgi:hypothetical protein
VRLRRAGPGERAGRPAPLTPRWSPTDSYDSRNQPRSSRSISRIERTGR